MGNNTTKQYAVLKKGSLVVINGNKVKLGKSIAKGGEGETFELPQNKVAKIYIKKNSQESKIEHIIGINIQDKEIVAPIAVIRDSYDNFRGYEMPKAFGTSLEKLGTSPIPSERWKGWTRKNLVEACFNIVNILNKVYTLPGHDILIGDLNLGNFMSSSPGNVVLIDFDSVQIDNYPCPVGQEKFSPPEILKIDASRSNIVLQKCNEEFSVAVLLFYILCGGIHPFSKRGGGSPKENILNGNFPYNEDGSVSNLAPLTGNPNFYWAFLPQGIRKAFCDTFNAKDKKERTSVVQWCSLFAKYLNDFDSRVKKDPEANNIILTRYPKWETPKGTEECLACHQFKPSNQIVNHLCFMCHANGFVIKQRKCVQCGVEEYVAVLGDKNSEDSSDFICSTCMKEENLTCYVCGNQFAVRHYKKKEYLLDKRVICNDCRNKFNQIKESVLGFKTIKKNLPPFEKIPFAELFKDIEKKAEEYIPFLKKINNVESKHLLRCLWELLLQYQEQVKFCEYQERIKRPIEEEKSPAILQTSLNSYRQLKDEIRNRVFIVEVEGHKLEFAYIDLPYYKHLNDSLEKKIISVENKLQDIIQQKTEYAKEVLSEANSSFLPGKFYSINFDKQLSNIDSVIKSLNEIQDYPGIRKLRDELTENRKKSELGKELKEKTERYINCDKITSSERRGSLFQIREIHKQVDGYCYILGESLCSFIEELLNQQESKIIQTYKGEPTKILDKDKDSYTLEEFYSTNFNYQVLRINSCLKSLDEVLDYSEIRKLYDKLIPCQVKAECRAFLRKKTEKFFKCNEIDIHKSEDALLEIEDAYSLVNYDSFCLDVSLRESILEILRQRKAEINNTNNYLSFYDSIKVTDVYTIYKNKKILLMKTPDYIKGFNATKIQNEAECIWSICDAYETAITDKNINKKYAKIQEILTLGAKSYSEYRFFDDIKSSFQKITQEYNAYIQRENKLKELTTGYKIKKKRLVVRLIIAIVCLITAGCFLITHFVNLSDGIFEVDSGVTWLFWKLWIIGIAFLIIGMILYLQHCMKK